MTRSALVRIASLVVATTALRAAPARYKTWLNEDVVYIITGSERAEFLKLSTDEQRDKFIAQFWQDRDPPPGAPQHDMKAEHYRRIAFANEHFGTASGTPGLKEGSRTPLHHLFIPIPFELRQYRHVEGIEQGIDFDFNGCGKKQRLPVCLPPSHRLEGRKCGETGRDHCHVACATGWRR